MDANPGWIIENFPTQGQELSFVYSLFGGIYPSQENLDYILMS
jgi:hypothetical protein